MRLEEEHEYSALQSKQSLVASKTLEVLKSNIKSSAD